MQRLEKGGMIARNLHFLKELGLRLLVTNDCIFNSYFR